MSFLISEIIAFAAKDGIVDTFGKGINDLKDNPMPMSLSRGKEFIKLCEDARMFVFTDQIDPIKSDLYSAALAHKHGIGEMLSCPKCSAMISIVPEVDLPFKTCWFEMSSAKPLFKIDYEYPDSAIPPMYVTGLLANEISPMKYEFYYSATIGESKYQHTFYMSPDDPKIDSDMFVIIMRALAAYLNQVGKQRSGVLPSAERIKVKVDGEKMLLKIRKIVYIKPKSDKDIPSGLGGIVWSHSWEVRGHWKEIPGKIGHDREGNPCKGFGWWKSHRKGPEHLPVVKKVRVFSEGGHEL